MSTTGYYSDPAKPAPDYVRIGNYYWFINSTEELAIVGKVVAINEDSVTLEIANRKFQDVNLKSLNPIIITRDLLKRLNFKSKQIDLTPARLIYNSEKDTYSLGLEKESEINFPVATLHMVQNLFFDLKGTELEVTF
jgi:hypothetical protein